MARLIDAHDLWSDIMMLPHNGDMISSKEVERAIMDAPTVDAVEVVRCKDCKFYDEDTSENGECKVKRCVVCGTETIMAKYGFCSCGERKDND